MKNHSKKLKRYDLLLAGPEKNNVIPLMQIQYSAMLQFRMRHILYADCTIFREVLVNKNSRSIQCKMHCSGIHSNGFEGFSITFRKFCVQFLAFACSIEWIGLI